MNTFKSIHHLIQSRKEAIFAYQKKHNQWLPITYSQFLNSYLKLSAFFRSIDIDAQSSIAIFSKTRIEWNLVDFAIQANRCITVGLYSNDSDRNINNCLKLTNPKLLVLESYEQLAKIQSIDSDWGWSKPVIVMDANHCQAEPVYHLASILKKPLCEKKSQIIENDINNIASNEIISYIFTSGTSGEQKAVVLTQGNLYHTAQVYKEHYPISQEDKTLLFLPMSHIFARVMFYASIHWGQNHYYLESVDELVEQLKLVNPTTLLVVPRLLEKVMANIEKNVAEKNLLSRLLYRFSLFSGRLHNTSPLPKVVTRPLYYIADRLILNSLRKIFGSSLRFVGAGGGHLSPEVCRYFWSIGIPVYEGYASTESGGLGIFNYPKDSLIGSIGKPILPVECKTEKDGELLMKSPSVALGYLSKTGLQRFDEWISTGDIAEVDLSGYYRISDRKKDLIINAYGKNIAPSWIEDQFLIHADIENIIVIGHNRPYLTALIVPTENQCSDEYVYSTIGDIVSHVNQRLSRHEQIKQFALIPPFEIENQQLTSTMKKRRFAIENSHRDIIERLYATKSNRLVTQ
ncbi:AMP-binding protein [Bermanella marisrubri]|uniref:AMP-dependent synthetase and ligase n=1 Tax=Bermanella marisrubri TaxID=207949 RepID=Q1MY50_9GAMM|nr:AMP-binding protein [Bermanella marisrubri]EAT10910.1 AMP-dependent synthetase and ligase [Oceanobacter sp. RED65] [Bermanella marisrubri]QIZ85323.1 AMP-binding protein [Bermanella marisrubri]